MKTPKYPSTQVTGKNAQTPDWGVARLSFSRSFADWVIGYLGTFAAIAALAIWVFGYLGTCEAAEQPASIPEAKISELRADLAEAAKGRTSVEIRRACKSVIRKVESIFESSPDAVNKYAALDILFEGQKRLLTLESTESNRTAIYETCAKLKDAPDEYAETRFDADMILSEKKLAEADATVAERTEALEEMLARYRGTTAEWKSLVVGSLIATKLLDFDLEKQINNMMAERFGGDHKVIEFRKKRDAGAKIDAVFAGSYKCQDGRTLVFPNDLMGHQYVVCFWSETMPELEKNLAAFKNVQDSVPGRLRVFSFNVDELPDAGEKILRKMKLDWTAVHLPGGRGASAFQAYATRDPFAVLVNGQGHALLYPPPRREFHGVGGIDQGWNLPKIVQTLDSERYLAQLRYLLIGDFLFGSGNWQDSGGKDSGINSDVASECQSIAACFTLPPFRYRLSQKESLANYRKAEQLCAAAIKKYSKEPDVWVIRNIRIIALIGMWNLESDSKYLDEAVKEANTVLDMDLPTGADVAARFCLAKAKLRGGDADPEKVLADLVKDTGDAGQVLPAALASAAVLAIEGNARAAHEVYRKRLLSFEGEGGGSLWPVYAFLRDSHHRYRNFYASPGGNGYNRTAKYAFRNMVSGLSDPVDLSRKLKVELNKVDGGRIRIPEDYADEPLGVIFAEPTESQSVHSNLMIKVNGFAGQYSRKGVKVVVAFLSDDTNTVRALVKDITDEHKAGILPGGLSNPLVQRLGILSADRVPNLLLLRSDGSIAWSISGIEYRYFGNRNLVYPAERGIEANIEKITCDEGFHALEKGYFKKALKLFHEYQPPDRNHDWWAADRMHGKALAYMGMNDWNAALKEIDAAMEKRRDDFKSAMCKCHGIVEMLLTRAIILEKLGRDREAKLVRREAGAENLPHAKLPPGLARAGVPVGVYYDWLKQIRLELENTQAGK